MLLLPHQAMKRFGLSKQSTLHDLANAGYLPVIRTPGGGKNVHFRYDEEHLERAFGALRRLVVKSSSGEPDAVVDTK